MVFDPRFEKYRDRPAYGWSPFSLSGIALWLDANDSNTLSIDSGKVATWADRSGNNRNLTNSNSALRPTTSVVSGRQTVTGDGTQYLYYSGNTGVNTAECTVACVFYSNGIESWRGIHSAYDASGDTATTSSYAVHGGASGSAPRFQVGTVQTLGSLAVPTPITIVVARRSVTLNEQKMWVNGGARPIGAASGGGVPANGFSVLARNNGNFGSYLNGGINEVLSINAAISDADVQRLEGYLAHKWALTANLPANHLYKNVSP